MVTLSSELLFLVLWISLLLDRGYLSRNWVYCCILFQEPCVFATRVISQCSLFIISWQTFRPCKLKKEKRVRNLVAWTLQVPGCSTYIIKGKAAMTISYVITYSVIYDQVKTGSLESRAEAEELNQSQSAWTCIMIGLSCRFCFRVRQSGFH